MNINSPGGDEHSEEMVAQLIAEAMAMDVSLQPKAQQTDSGPDTRYRPRLVQCNRSIFMLSRHRMLQHTGM